VANLPEGIAIVPQTCRTCRPPLLRPPHAPCKSSDGRLGQPSVTWWEQANIRTTDGPPGRPHKDGTDTRRGTDLADSRLRLAALAVSAAAPVVIALGERGAHRRTVQQRPANFVFRSVNFDLLCALLDKVPEQHRSTLFAASLSRLSSSGSYHDRSREALGAGQWRRCSSELPLVAEFNVRRGDRRLFIAKLSEVALSPGLTHLMIHLGEMVALNFTVFTDAEYRLLQAAVAGVRAKLPELQRQAKPRSTIESNVVHNVSREVPALCDSVFEECRQAGYLYLKGTLQFGSSLDTPVGIIERTPHEETPAALSSQYRFQIALSFPGEARHRVEKIAEVLSTSAPKAAILYDKWLSAELARPGLDVYLTNLYKNGRCAGISGSNRSPSRSSTPDSFSAKSRKTSNSRWASTPRASSAA
jgi:hypothetical protein